MEADRLAEIRQTIKETRPTVDKLPYSHNIINLCLQEIDEKHGIEEVHNAIRDFKLHLLGWKKPPEKT